MLTILKWLKDVAVFALHLLDKALAFAVCFVLVALATDNIGLSLIVAAGITYTYSVSSKVRKVERLLKEQATGRAFND